MAASRRCSVIPDSKHPPGSAARWRSSAPWSRTGPPHPAPTSRRCWPPAPPDSARTVPPPKFPPQTTTAMPTVASAPDHSDEADEALPAGVTSLAERRGRKRRLAIVGGAVVGAMTLGAGAVAASSGDFRESVNHTVGMIFQPSGEAPDVAPKPAKPSPADIPAAPVPSKAAGATTPPAADAVPQAPGSAAEVPAKPGADTPPAVGRGGVLPTPPQRPVTPGIPGLPGTGGDRELPANPLPEPTLPGVLPTIPAQP